MKTYTFSTSNNNNAKKFFTFNFRKSPKSTDYSKILDDLILDNLKKTNSYLSDYIKKEEDAKVFSASTAALKSDNFINAAKFLANYNEKKYFPFIFGKIYKLIDGTTIIFYDDEVQIGRDVYSYNDLKDFNFLNALSAPQKKLIVDVYAYGTKISIEINK